MTALLLMMRRYFHIQYWSSNQEHDGMIARPCVRQRYIYRRRVTERGTRAERIRGETANYGSGIEKHHVHRTLRRINEQRLAAVDRDARISREYANAYSGMVVPAGNGARGLVTFVTVCHAHVSVGGCAFPVHVRSKRIPRRWTAMTGRVDSARGSVTDDRYIAAFTLLLPPLPLLPGTD
ncbi:hypothetical protein P5V15_005047 [Pogonomyrmex californicus]